MTRSEIRKQVLEIWDSLGDSPVTVKLQTLMLLEKLTPASKVVAPSEYGEKFEAFWERWKEVSAGAKTQQVKAGAAKSWKEAEADAIMKGLERYNAYLKANPDKRDYIPMVTTWLNQRRWEAEATTKAATEYRRLDELT